MQDQAKISMVGQTKLVLSEKKSVLIRVGLASLSLACVQPFLFSLFKIAIFIIINEVVDFFWPTSMRFNDIMKWGAEAFLLTQLKVTTTMLQYRRHCVDCNYDYNALNARPSTTKENVAFQPLDIS